MTHNPPAGRDTLVQLAESDPHRPRFHFVSPAGWLNDPNGLGVWGGRYHLFYQYNPGAPVHGDIHWGHATSTDLVSWEDEPIALAPSEGPDEDGCWSGVLVDDGGTPTLVYSGNRAGQQRTCLAIGDPELRGWTKLDSNPVIPAPPPGLDILEYRDHSVWREGDEWVQLMGAGIVGEGGAVLRYRSSDLREWTYDGVHLADESYSADSWTGDVWECPDFFPLGDSHVLVASAWVEGRTIRPFYITGRYVDGTFTPEHRERLDYGERHFYAPQSFTDTTGRRVMFGWIQEARSPASAHEVGWSGVMSLPRVVTLAPDGTVFQSPVPEVAQLRGATERHESVDLAASEHLDLEMRGDLVDLEVELALDETAVVRLWLRQTADRSRGAMLVLDAARGTVTLDRTLTTDDESVETTALAGTLPLGADRRVELRVVVDRSVVEVFANGRVLTGRIYPDVEGAEHYRLEVQDGTASVRSVQAWSMSEIWSQPRSRWP